MNWLWAKVRQWFNPAVTLTPQQQYKLRRAQRAAKMQELQRKAFEGK